MTMQDLKDLLSDDSHVVPAILSGIAMIACIVWVTMLIRHNYALPDFSGMSLFVGVPYGLHKITGTLSDITINRTGNGGGNGERH